jgi:hypothetical protein
MISELSSAFYPTITIFFSFAHLLHPEKVHNSEFKECSIIARHVA